VDTTTTGNTGTAGRTRRRVAAIVTLAVVVGAGGYLGRRFTKNEPEKYDDIVEHYKYGSLNSEGFSPPYWIWKALPVMFPDLLPGGYDSLGFTWEDGHDLPVGFSKRRMTGYDALGLNCAICHASSVRETPTSKEMVIAGMPAQTFDIEGYFRFLMNCATDQRFTPAAMIPVMESLGAKLDPIDELLYTYLLIPQTRMGLLRLRSRLVPLLFDDRVPSWGMGRVDTFNPYKAIQLNYPMDQVPVVERTGAADFPQIWNQEPREGKYLHWDGNNNSVAERNLGAALGTGVTPVTLDHEALDRITAWLFKLPPPKYPFARDAALAGKGAPIYQQRCAGCHEVGGAETFHTVPVEVIGTDPFRFDSYTYDLTVNQASLYAGTKYRFTHWHKSDGYANQLLDGIWARAPYLHNGSVPSLRDLLEPVEKRPKVFYRGNNVYDQARVGFVSDVEEQNKRKFFRYDTTVAGNANTGHLYGVDLSPEQKDALVEYMKSL
jgi:mono/diheme cytochrome c family protein